MNDQPKVRRSSTSTSLSQTIARAIVRIEEEPEEPAKALRKRVTRQQSTAMRRRQSMLATSCSFLDGGGPSMPSLDDDCIDDDKPIRGGGGDDIKPVPQSIDWSALHKDLLMSSASSSDCSVVSSDETAAAAAATPNEFEQLQEKVRRETKSCRVVVTAINPRKERNKMYTKRLTIIHRRNRLLSIINASASPAYVVERDQQQATGSGLPSKLAGGNIAPPKIRIKIKRIPTVGKNMNNLRKLVAPNAMMPSAALPPPTTAPIRNAVGRPRKIQNNNTKVSTKPVAASKKVKINAKPTTVFQANVALSAATGLDVAVQTSPLKSVRPNCYRRSTDENLMLFSMPADIEEDALRMADFIDGDELMIMSEENNIEAPPPPPPQQPAPPLDVAAQQASSSLCTSCKSSLFSVERSNTEAAATAAVQLPTMFSMRSSTLICPSVEPQQQQSNQVEMDDRIDETPLDLSSHRKDGEPVPQNQNNFPLDFSVQSNNVYEMITPRTDNSSSCDTGFFESPIMMMSSSSMMPAEAMAATTVESGGGAQQATVAATETMDAITDSFIQTVDRCGKFDDEILDYEPNTPKCSSEDDDEDEAKDEDDIEQRILDIIRPSMPDVAKELDQIIAAAQLAGVIGTKSQPTPPPKSLPLPQPSSPVVHNNNNNNNQNMTVKPPMTDRISLNVCVNLSTGLRETKIPIDNRRRPPPMPSPHSVQRKVPVRSPIYLKTQENDPKETRLIETPPPSMSSDSPSCLRISTEHFIVEPPTSPPRDEVPVPDEKTTPPAVAEKLFTILPNNNNSSTAAAATSEKMDTDFDSEEDDIMSLFASEGSRSPSSPRRNTPQLSPIQNVWCPIASVAPKPLITNFKIPKRLTTTTAAADGVSAVVPPPIITVNGQPHASYFILKKFEQQHQQQQLLRPTPPAPAPLLVASASTPEFAKILKLFNSPCLRYLKASCNGVNCHYAHNLPSAAHMSRVLHHVPDISIEHIYNNFVLRFPKAFDLYFPLFCPLFAKHGNKVQLMKMVYDIQVRSAVNNYVHIKEALQMCGLTSTDALANILIESHKHPTNGIIIDKLIALAIECDCKGLIKHLQLFARIGTYKFRTDVLNELIDRALAVSEPKFVCDVMAILDTWEGTIAEKQIMEPKFKHFMHELTSKKLISIEGAAAAAAVPPQ